MMYIEHTALEDNLQHILTDRVPTSSTSATEAASALLVRVGEGDEISALDVIRARAAVGGSATIKSTRALNGYGVAGAEDKFRIVATKDRGQLSNASAEVKSGADLDEYQEEEEEQEERYELIDVIDEDDSGQEKHTELELQLDEEPEDTHANHIFIEIDDRDEKDRGEEEEEEFEYIVTRVPKRRSDRSIRAANRVIPRRAAAVGRGVRCVVPKVVPIQTRGKRLLNGNLPLHHLSRRSASGYRYPEESYSYIEQNGFEDDGDYVDYSEFEGPNEAVPVAAYNSCDYTKRASMGLDIINRLRQLLNWNSSSSHNGTAHQEGKRKRRSDDWTAETASPHQIKYRKVDNRFPKYVATYQEDDDGDIVPSKYGSQFSSPTPAAPTKSTFDMASRRPLQPQKKSQQRRSIFSAPQITHQLIKNTSYADVEFSDDDEPVLIKGFGSIAPSNKRMTSIYNIPISHRSEERLKATSKPSTSPLVERRSGNILASSLVPELDAIRRPTYADALRHGHRLMSGGNSQLVSGRTATSSVSSSGASTSASARIFNGFSNLRTNPWSSNVRSILSQEKESEEREKYQQLLEQVVPRLYGTENKIVQNTGTRRRSTLLGNADTSSARSSPSVIKRSSDIQKSMKRPLLSSTINLDDDGDEKSSDDEDVTVTGVTHLKPLRQPTKHKIATVIIDDDDISDIIELGNEERKLLSSRANIKDSNDAVINLCGESEKEKVKKTCLPYVEPVNSLQERFNSSPHIKDNWLENWQMKWSQRKKNRIEEVQETTKVAEQLSAERRAAEAEIQERFRKFQIVDPELLVIDDFVEPTPEPEFLELSEDHQSRINGALCGPPDQVLISKFNLNITRRDIHTLHGHNWLNDEVINFYMNLLTERGEKKHESHGLPTVYAMNTFFVPRLMQAGHGGVKRWTRKVDIFTRDILPVPVHVGGVHWCMAIIHLKNRTIKYYDSMGTPNPNVLKALEQYLKDESLDKRKQPFDTSQFEIESVQDVPRQMNGSDCGVFSCMFAEYITRNKEITFSQQNMEYFRHKMILEIVQGELLQ